MIVRALVMAVLTLAAVSPRQAPHGVGVVTLSVADPLTGRPMQAVAFYPAAGAATSVREGPYTIDATPNAAADSGGPFPLIVLSPGRGGSRWSLHDLATFLAAQGFVVASLDHPRDNDRDTSGVGTDAVLLGRPKQMSAVIDAVLADPRLGSHVDAHAIGAAGFDTGGYAALVLAGARPNFDLLPAFCRAHEDDQRDCAGSGRVGITHPELTAVADPRVKSVLAMAPVGIFFDAQALNAVRLPVLVYAAKKDRVLPARENADAIRRALPRLFAYRTIDDADHFVFLAPCSDSLRARDWAHCVDPDGVNRAAVHARLDADALAFFAQTLTPRWEPSAR